MVPIFILIITSGQNYSYHYALIIFIFASLTDALDGKLARKFNAESKFGAFFDPLADKILILSAFIVFLELEQLEYIIRPWMVFLILSRDLLVTILRFSIKSMGLSMVTSKIAKLKTSLQLISVITILFFLSFYPTYLSDTQIMEVFMIVITLFTVYTGVDYYYKNVKLILTQNR